jgi:ComF family protein
VGREETAVNQTGPNSVDSLWGRLQRVVLPPHCLLCGRDGGAARDLCLPCAADLERNRIACPRCALPLQTAAPLCGECLQREPPFDAAFAPFIYGHPLDLLVAKLKFGRSLAAGRVLAELWLDALAGAAPEPPNLLVPVPLHASRLRERGYNQALELAKPIARALRIALDERVLSRVKATAAQSNLDAKTRRQNLRGAFEFKPDALSEPKMAHVALVDDVMTTGTTLRECARVLKRAGVARVDVWVLARAPKSR